MTYIHLYTLPFRKIQNYFLITSIVRFVLLKSYLEKKFSAADHSIARNMFYNLQKTKVNQRSYIVGTISDYRWQRKASLKKKQFPFCVTPYTPVFWGFKLSKIAISSLENKDFVYQHTYI